MNTYHILSFLSELGANNNKEWMDANRGAYLQAKADFEALVNVLLQNLQAIDPGLNGLTGKDCIFRINRDIRFSKDKSPYKHNFGASIAEGGKKSLNAGYYLHIQPGDESFFGGGLYMPAGAQLKKVRQEIDYNAPELLKIVTAEDFKQAYGRIQGEKLSRAPKGYDPHHPNIEFLKLKSYVALHKLSDDDIKSPKLIENLTHNFQVLKPFIDFLNVAIS